MHSPKGDNNSAQRGNQKRVTVVVSLMMGGRVDSSADTCRRVVSGKLPEAAGAGALLIPLSLAAYLYFAGSH